MRNCDGVLIVYDVTKETPETTDKVLNACKETLPPDTPIAIFGNKVDLFKDSLSALEQRSEKRDNLFFGSAKENVNVEDVFFYLFYEAICMKKQNSLTCGFGVQRAPSQNHGASPLRHSASSSASTSFKLRGVPVPERTSVTSRWKSCCSLS